MDSTSLPLLSPADTAISHLLDLVQTNEDLRHQLLDTHAHVLLIAAEAARLGIDAELHRIFRRQWRGETGTNGHPPVPRQQRYQERLERYGMLG